MKLSQDINVFKKADALQATLLDTTTIFLYHSTNKKD